MSSKSVNFNKRIIHQRNIRQIIENLNNYHILFKRVDHSNTFF